MYVIAIPVRNINILRTKFSHPQYDSAALNVKYILTGFYDIACQYPCGLREAVY